MTAAADASVRSDRSPGSAMRMARAIAAITAIPTAVLILDRGSAQFDRRFTGRCPCCDYDLRGLKSSACPECGSGVEG